MKDILEEAGVKSVSTSVQDAVINLHLSCHCSCSHFFLTLNPLQKKTQKRKFREDDFDDDIDVEPQLKYKGKEPDYIHVGGGGLNSSP